jgi:hypothetical protein
MTFPAPSGNLTARGRTPRHRPHGGSNQSGPAVSHIERDSSSAGPLRDTASGAAEQRLHGPLFRGMADAFEWFERRQAMAEIQRDFGAWLSGTFLFNHFVTITLRDRIGGDGTRVQSGRCTLNAAWREWCHECHRLNGSIYPASVRVVEYQRRGVPHIHALTVNTVPLIGSEHRLADHLWAKFGKCRVTRFDPRHGAAGYLTKYLAKDARVEISATGRLEQYARPGAGVSFPLAQKHCGGGNCQARAGQRTTGNEHK